MGSTGDGNLRTRDRMPPDGFHVDFDYKGHVCHRRIDKIKTNVGWFCKGGKGSTGNWVERGEEVVEFGDEKRQYHGG